MSDRPNPRRIVSVQNARPKVAKASSYIDEAKIRAGVRVVLVLRVSTGSQDAHNNLENQEENLWRIVEERGGRVVGTFSRCGSGTNPEWLGEAAAHARNCTAVMLAESVDRFIRPVEYHSVNCPNAQATEADLKRLRLVCGEVRLMTVVNPDAPLAAVRAYQTRRGQSQKGRKGGRPRARKAGYKKQEGRRRMSDVLELLWVGNSRRTIAELLDLHPTQVQRDINRIRDGEVCTHFLCTTKWYHETFPTKQGQNRSARHR